MPDQQTNLDNMLTALEAAPPADDGTDGFEVGGSTRLSQEVWESPTVATLDPSRRPEPSTICERCPHAMWLAFGEELQCFCRVMHVMTYTSAEPSCLRACDGILIGQE